MRFALRRVVNVPGFSLSVIVILALGVAAAATMASVLNALAFKKLLRPNPDALISVTSTDSRGLVRGIPVAAVDRVRDANLAADAWCGYSTTLDATESGGRVMEMFGEVMTGDCLPLIGVAPVMGRWFTPDEAPVTGPGKPVMVITDTFWTAMFDRQAAALGSTVRIADTDVTVIGVMPPAFDGFSPETATGYIVPFNAHRPIANARLLARLPDGSSVSGLESQLKAFWPSLLDAVVPASPTRAQTIAETGVSIEPIAGGFSTLRRLYAAPLQRMAILAGALLLLVSINVGGLLVSRVMARSQEFASMRAIGASTFRIARPLASEGLIYAIAGAALGVPLSFAASAAFATLLPTGNVPWNIDLTPDPRVLAAIVATSMAVALVIAALPIWLATGQRAGLGITRAVARSGAGWARGLLVVQVAVTLMLVFSAGLIVRSFNTLRALDRGYSRDHLLSLRLAVNPGGYRGMDATAYYRSMIDRARALPGVESAGLPRFFGTLNGSTFEAPVGLHGSGEPVSTGMVEYISPGYSS
ncbi:MAG: ABC transporter permease [Acidimicrobiia bacterium]